MSQKGSAFERKISVLLSEWWTNGERDDIFWRTDSSGGRAKRRGRQGKKTYGRHGDICASDPIGQPLIDCFTIEIKRGYSKASIVDLLDKPKGAKNQYYEEWIEQAEESQRQAGTPFWIIIHQRDRRLPLVIAPRVSFEDFGFYDGHSADVIDFQSSNYEVRIILLEEFLKVIKVQHVKDFMDNYKIRDKTHAKKKSR